ncbi:agmatine deiminase family protein [Pacificispira sp.]|uniref:agmatine deiminase family protein n=1 Tax=Pacificispira sp. TaxID=2888761 RepID=UPI003BAB0CBB
MTAFRMPAEWEPHIRTWMVWPHRQEMWAPDLTSVQKDYAAVARAIARFEPVRMIADPSAAEGARAVCGGEVEVVAYPVDDSWFRDTGPSFVISPEGRAGVSWRFNAWGGKTEHFDKDAALAASVLRDLNLPVLHSALATEGGALHVDGEGTLLTTDTVILNPNRNPGIRRDKAEAIFARTLGVEKTIWLPGNPYETGTDGHIDGIACFTAPGKVLVEIDPEADADEAAVARRNIDILRDATDAKGRRLEITELRAAPRRDTATTENFDFCNCYINFYVCNGGVVMPGFDLPGDAEARAVVQAAFPGREIVQVPILALATGGGSIHCITQQEPVGAAPAWTL